MKHTRVLPTSPLALIGSETPVVFRDILSSVPSFLRQIIGHGQTCGSRLRARFGEPPILCYRPDENFHSQVQVYALWHT